MSWLFNCRLSFRPASAGTVQTRYIGGRNLAEALFVPRAGATDEDDGRALYLHPAAAAVFVLLSCCSGGSLEAPVAPCLSLMLQLPSPLWVPSV